MKPLVAVVGFLLIATSVFAQNQPPHSGIGPCPMGQVVTRLNQNAPPTCAPAGTGPSFGAQAFTANGTVTGAGCTTGLNTTAFISDAPATGNTTYDLPNAVLCGGGQLYQIEVTQAANHSYTFGIADTDGTPIVSFQNGTPTMPANLLPVSVAGSTPSVLVQAYKDPTNTVWLVNWNTNPTGPITNASGASISGAITLTGAPDSITPSSVSQLDVNGVIDPCAHGFGCNMTTDQAVTFTHSSATVTSTSNLWAASMVGQLINLYDGSSACTAAATPSTCCTGIGTGTCSLTSITSRETFSGTIAGFNNPGSIAISSTYAGATNTGSPSEAIWASDDLAAWNALQTYIGALGAYRPARIAIRKPIMTSGELVYQNKSGEIAGTGIGANLLVNPALGSVIVWAGPAGGSMLRVKNSWGANIHDLSFQAGTVAPPFAAINLQQVVGGMVGGQHRIDHIQCGTDSLGTGPGTAPIGPVSTGTMSGDHSISDTSIAMTAAPVGLGPNQLVWFFDETAGPEIAYTTNAYVSGASPILLSTGLSIAHTSAQTSVRWGTPTMLNCIAYDPVGSQDDTAIISNVRAFNVDSLYALLGQSVSSVLLDDGICNQCNVGFVDIKGGDEQLRGYQWNGTALGFYGAQGAHIVASVVSNELGGTIGGNGSPNLLYLGGAGGSRFECDSCTLVTNGNMPVTGTDADFIDENPTTTTAIYLNDLIFGEDQQGLAMAAGIKPSIHVRITANGTGARSTRVIGERTSGMAQDRILDYVETGSSSDTRYQRLVEILQTPSRTGELPVYTNQSLQGSDTFNRFQHDIGPSYLTAGPVALRAPLTAPSVQGTMTLTCVGGGTGTDYYFFASATDGTPTGETPVGAANTTAVNCTAAGSMDASHYIKGTINALVRGAAGFKIYVASCAHSCANPGSTLSGLALTVPTNTAALNGQNPPAWQYLGTTPGAAPPTVNTTNTLSVGGLLHRTAAAVSTLPAICGAGDTQAVTDWNGTNGACTGGGSNYVVATCGASNNWFCP